MKKIKRVVSVLLMMAVVAGGCSSCGTTKTTGGKVKLSVSNWPTTEGKSLDDMNKKKADFEAENSNIEIVPDTWNFDLRTFYPKAEAKMLPDIYVAPYTEIDKLIDGEYAADLTSALKEVGWYDMYNPRIKDLLSRDGKMWLIPSGAYVMGVAYNIKMLEAAGLVEADGTPKQPKTWEEWAEFAVKIKEATGKPGIVLCTTNNTGGWQFMNIAWSYGVDFMEQQSDGSWKATFNTEEMVQALQFVKDLRWKYDVITANILVNQEEQQKVFATGGAGMMISAPAEASIANLEMNPDEYGMMAIPAGPKKHVSLIGGNFRCLSNGDEEQIDAAIKWLDFVGAGYRFDDVTKQNMKDSMETKVSNNEAIGIRSMSIWGDNNERNEYNNQLIDEYYNMKPNAAKLYNESLADSALVLQPEEPVCAQDLYGVLDNCIQQVLNDENADCKQIIEKANTDFQTNYLNNVDY